MEKLDVLIGRIDERTLMIMNEQEVINEAIKRMNIEIQELKGTSALEDEKIRTTIQKIAVIVSMIVSGITAVSMLLLQWILSHFKF